MSAAYDSMSMLAAGVVLEGASAADQSELVPDPPASGIKAAFPSGTQLIAAVDRQRAFRAVYESQAAFVWRNLRRLGVSDADVEDKLQEVFVVAHRRWDEFIDRGHGPRAWLFQIALRVASDARRHRRRHPVDPDGGAAQERQSIEAPQAVAFDKRQQLDLLDRALATIDMGRRAVLVLHEIEQMTAPEISRTLDIPLNTVYSRLRVARIELEQELRRIAGTEGQGGGAR